VLILSFWSLSAPAQQDTIFIKGKDLTSVLFLNETIESNRIPRSDLPFVFAQSIAKGFWLTSIDSIRPKRFEINCGRKHEFAEIHAIFPPQLLVKFPNLYMDSIFSIHSYIDLEHFKKEQVNQLENIGYPFAQITIQQKNEVSSTLMATIFTGPLVFWDTTIIKGDYKLDTKLIQVGLQTPRSGFYTEEAFRKISNKKHANLNYIKPPEILFVKDKAHLFLYIDEVSKNSIGGLIGFNGSKGNFNIIGNVDLKLNNKFHRFETLEVHWQAFDDQSQKLNLSLKFPHVFKSVFGFVGQLDVLRQDSAFVNYKLGSSFSYYLNNKHQVATGIRFETSNSIQTNESESSFDVRKKLYLINYEYSKPEGYFRKLKTEIAAGNRSTKDKTQSYSQVLFESSAGIPIYKWLSTYVNVEAQKMLADNLSSNELYRIGGFNSIRGFNELSISAQSYALVNTELRLKIDANSFLFGFSDFGKIETLNSTNNLWGVGLGFQLKSKAGQFAIAYGLGKFDQDPIDFGASKIHFGYINEF
jgi:hypothetical protein